jgi:L-2-hydroxyglutarate oxidase LhgO
LAEQVDVTVVGAGVVGVAVARALTAAGREVFVLEKNPGVTQGENQSSRNSGVIHSGLYYDQATRPLKARLCVRGNSLLYDFCAAHGLPHRRCGKLVVATRPEQLPTLELYAARAAANGVPASIISGEQAREMEPAINARAALLLPTAGIIEPTALVHQLYAQASAAGAQFLTGVTLVAARPTPEGLVCTLRYIDGAADEFLSRAVVNCAGLYSDEVARLLDPDSPWRIDPMRGEAACFSRLRRAELGLKSMNVYPTPHQVTLPGGTYWTVGVHLTPTLEPAPEGQAVIGGTVSVGPLNFAARHKQDYGGEPRPAAEFKAQVADFFPGLRAEDLSPYQVGVQARLAGEQDWVIAPARCWPAWINLLGIDSPGLTSALAIAEMVAPLIPA